MLRFSPVAEEDLEEIADYIALDSPANAIWFVDTRAHPVSLAQRTMVSMEGTMGRPTLTMKADPAPH